MIDLRPFQQDGVRRIYAFRGRALLADEMGLGKTVQALRWIQKIPKHRPAVIVTPASMKYTWRAEASMHFGMRAEVLEGFYRRKRLIKLPGEIVVINYEILKSWLPVILNANPKCVILDEVHYVSNPAAQRTKAVFKLTQNCTSVVGLSGTPLTNRPIQLWSVLAIIRPDLFPSRQKFAWRYCKPRYTPWGWQYRGATRLDELNSVLRSECMIRRLKRDVLPELPDKIHKVISLRLRSYDEYRMAEKNFIAWLRTWSQSKANKARRAEALSKVGYLMRLVARSKLEFTTQWIEEFFESHPGKKLLALTMNTFVIDHLREKFGKRCAVIDGRVKGSIRVETVRQFQTHSKIDLMLGNWKAAGVGITAHAAHNAVALDLPWTPGDLVQGEDRVHRIGQKKNCIIHYLVTEDTVEERLMRILRRQSAVLNAVLDGEVASGKLDVFNALLSKFQ